MIPSSRGMMMVVGVCIVLPLLFGLNALLWWWFGWGLF